MIGIYDLNKVFTTNKKDLTVLRDINLTISKGSITGIIGISGAGKSTLLRLIGGLDQPTSGKIIVDHQDLTTLSLSQKTAFHKQVGTVFQGYNLLMQKNVFDNVALPLRINKVPKDVIKTKVEDLLALVDLSDKALAYPVQLSGGQKQRVALARALANDPKILLCDEPTSALDCLTTRSILQLLKKINEALHVTIVLITHDIDVIKTICDNVVVLHDAQVVELGPVYSILQSPQHAMTQQFLA